MDGMYNCTWCYLPSHCQVNMAVYLVLYIYSAIYK